MCSARAGDHLYHACFDLGACVSVHPSTVAMAMLAYDGLVDVAPGGLRPVRALMGDGTDPRRDNRLEDGALVTALVLPPPQAGEQSAYFRAISRARSEWPLVEVLVRLVVEDGAVAEAAIALGGVAAKPWRATRAEAALKGLPATRENFLAAAAEELTAARPLDGNAFKVGLTQRTIAAVLTSLAGERA